MKYMYSSKNSELEITLLLVNIIVNTECQQRQQNAVGLYTISTYKVDLRHEISNNVVCATSKASDRPAHTRSLIRAFASRLNIL